MPLTLSDLQSAKPTDAAPFAWAAPVIQHRPVGEVIARPPQPPPVTKEQVLLRFPLAKSITIEPITVGTSGNSLSKVTIDGIPNAWKAVGPATTENDGNRGKLFEKEVEAMTWASEADVGPKVVEACADSVTGYPAFCMAEWIEEDVRDRGLTIPLPDKWEAMLCASKKMYNFTIQTEVSYNRTAREMWSLPRLLGYLSARSPETQDPPLLAYFRSVAQSVQTRLAAYPYYPTMCHGDIHGKNALFDREKGKVLFIDWEFPYRGGPMGDLASTACYYDAGFCDLPGLYETFSRMPVDGCIPSRIFGANGLTRLKLYFILRLLHRLVRLFLTWGKATRAQAQQDGIGFAQAAKRAFCALEEGMQVMGLGFGEGCEVEGDVE